MITKDWSVAFTITFKGLQIDFMELPDHYYCYYIKMPF